MASTAIESLEQTLADTKNTGIDERHLAVVEDPRGEYTLQMHELALIANDIYDKKKALKRAETLIGRLSLIDQAKQLEAGNLLDK